MKVNDGLYPGANPALAKEDIKSYALNVMYNEDGATLINENGFELHQNYSAYGQCIGTIPIPTGVVLFFVKDKSSPIVNGVYAGDYIIYHTDSSIEGDDRQYDVIYYAEYTEALKGSILNFSVKRPISGTYSYNKNKNLIITFTEGVAEEANETRLLNLDTFGKDYNLPTRISTNSIRYSLGIKSEFAKRFNLIPDVRYPKLDINTVDGGGLLAGSYQFAIAYKLKTGEYTDYSLLSPTYFASPKYSEDIKIGNITSRKFKIDIKSHDDQYEECKLGIIYKGNSEEKAYEYYNVGLSTYSNTTTIYISGLDNLTPISLNDIVIGNISYIKDQAHTNFNSQLIRANVSVNDITGIDKTIRDNNLANSNNIKVSEVVLGQLGSVGDGVNNKGDFYDKDYSNMVGIKDQEYYFLYIGIIDYKGKLINVYPILNKSKNSYFFKSSNFNDTTTYHKQVRWKIDPTGFFTALFKDNKVGKQAISQIKSYVCFYAQPNSSNSNWCCQSLTVRDIDVNNVVGDNYQGPFCSPERFRVYPIEYMVTNKIMPQCHIYSVRGLKERSTNMQCINRYENESTNSEGKGSNPWEEGGDLLQSVMDATHLTVNKRLRSGPIVKPTFFANNNAAVSNTACDSCYKFGKGDGWNHNDLFDTKFYLGDYNNNTYFEEGITQTYSRGDYLDQWEFTHNKIVRESKTFDKYKGTDDDAGHGNDRECAAYQWRAIIENNRVIADYYYNNIDYDNEFAKIDVYAQNLTCATPIISVSWSESNKIAVCEASELRGDTFIAFLTQRCICPARGFKHEGAAATINNCHRIIVSYFIYSRMNLQARHSGNGTNSAVYKIFNRNYLVDPGNMKPWFNIIKWAPHNAYWQDVNNLAYVSYPIDNFFHTDDGACYEVGMNWDGFKDAVMSKSLELDTKHFPSRIIRSNVNPSEATDIGWRKFKADNYKDVSIQKGQIENVMSDDTAIYIQQRYTLLVAAIKDTLGNDKENATYVGTSDLFQREPKEIIYSATGKIGCNNRYAACITQYGYLVCDNEKGEIYLVQNDTNVKELSDVGFKEWFRNHIFKQATNPLTASGNFFTYDEINSRILFTVKILKDNGSIDYDNSYTLSYSLKTNLWSSFHSYIGDYSYINRKGIFYLKDGALFKTEARNKGIYFDSTIHPSVVQFVYCQEHTVSKLFKHLEWQSHLIDGIMSNDENIRYIYNHTIDWLMVHTDVQCTGLMPMGVSPIWWDNENLQYKAGRYLWNHIDDYVDNDLGKWQRNPNLINFMDVNQLAYYKNLSATSQKPWYDIAKIQNQWCYVTMIFENKFFDSLKDEMVDATDKNTALSISRNAKQLDFRLMNVELMIDKDSRL